MAFSAPGVTSTIVLGLAWLSFAIWLGLLFGRAGFWRTGPATARAAPPPAQWPRVIAIVPARNEAEVLNEALTSLLTQDYPGAFHLVLIDDHSSDGTADVARMTAATCGRAQQHFQDRLIVISARDLPAGWSGKVWAQSEGLAAAERITHRTASDTEYLFLTDADIRHPADTLRRLVARAEHERRDLVSLMVRLRCTSFCEKALIPAFVFFFMKLYPFARVNNPHSRVAAAAGGAMLVRRAALKRIGGMAAIKDALIDDCALAAQIKRGGPIRLDLADEPASTSLRAYDDWRSLWQMIARTAFTQLRYSPWRLIGALTGMALTYLAPPVLALGWGAAAWPAALAWAAMASAYMPTLRYYRRSLLWAPGLPLVALFYAGATWASAWRYWSGRGGQWKGRAQVLRTCPQTVADGRQAGEDKAQEPAHR